MTSDHFRSSLDGVTYGWTNTTSLQYERIGPIILIHHVSFDHDIVGFTDAPPFDYVVTEQDVAAAGDLFRPLIVSRLQAAGLIRS